MFRLLVVLCALSILSGCRREPPVQTGEDPVVVEEENPKVTVDPKPAEKPDAGPQEEPWAPQCLTRFAGLAITPAHPTLTVRHGSGAKLEFRAHVTAASGGLQEVTRKLSWTLKREGTDGVVTTRPLVHATFDSAAQLGGLLAVHADDTCGHGTSTDLTVVQETVFGSPSPELEARFGAAPAPEADPRNPRFTYPSGGMRFPFDTRSHLFQWSRGGGDRFRLVIGGRYSRILLYTSGDESPCRLSIATAGCAEVNAAVWKAITDGHAGESVRVVLEQVNPGEARVFRSAPVTIEISTLSLGGSIYYWSSAVDGLRRARLSSSTVEDLLISKPVPSPLGRDPQGNDLGTLNCVGCHTVSRSGKKMFGFTKAGATGELQGQFIYDVSRPDAGAVPLVAGTTLSLHEGMGTFSPDDSRVVSTVDDALVEFDATTGARIGALNVPVASGPDWSPSGAELVFSDQAGDLPPDAGLRVIERGLDGGWSAPRLLIPSVNNTHLFPSYSPDGRWIAYAQGRTGGHGDRSLQLFIISADGNSLPVELLKANRVLHGQETTGQHQNTVPTWVPAGPHGYWLLFNSMRPFGAAMATGNALQIWITWIDRDKLSAGQDPSTPAVRFPLQGLNEHAIRGFWVPSVAAP
jgi:hypothetical protein